MSGKVASVGRSPRHAFTKPPQQGIRLEAGLGVEDDAHNGVTVKHQSRVRVDPSEPNLRQVHLIHAELFAELAEAGFEVADGDLGENITTRGVDLLGLPTGARLHLGTDAIVEVTGLLNPCRQIDKFAPGLMSAVLGRDADGNLIRKTGVMSIVIAGGEVRPGDTIRVVLPLPPHAALKPV
jgi:MOSC domain-containing protein YiiM